MSKTTGKETKSNEEIFAGFQSLRNDQRQLANKISEIEMEVNEHKIVIETLQAVDSKRKCFRMIGGVLLERTVSDILPELVTNLERLPSAIEALNEQLTDKGKEINDYIEKYDIKVQRGAQQPIEAPSEELSNTKSNVLVSSG